MIPEVPAGSVPHLTTDQMIEVDRAMIEDYEIDLVRMMENAGRNLAHLARERFFDGDPRGRRVVVLAGTGGNGGGALVAGRRLHGYGTDVDVFITRRDADFTPVPQRQLAILRRMGLVIEDAELVDRCDPPDLIIDGLIGYRLSGAPGGAAGVLIRWANEQDVPVLSLDVPSGVDTTTGVVYDPAIRADATLTLALPKEGLRTPGVAGLVGDLYLADISVPPELYEKFLGLDVGPIFSGSEILRLR